MLDKAQICAELEANIGERDALDIIARNHGLVQCDGTPYTYPILLLIAQEPVYERFNRKHPGKKDAPAEQIIVVADTGLWTDEQKRDIAARYNSGQTTPYIAQVYGKTPCQIKGVLERLRDNGVEIARRRGTDKDGKIAKLYNSGKTTGQVATMMNCSQQTVRNALSRMRKKGAEIRRAG